MREGSTLIGLKSLIAPYAPFSGTVIGPVCVEELKLRVAVSKVPAGCVEVNCTPIWQVVGAVCGVKQVLPLNVKSLAYGPPVIAKLLSVACPVPVTFTVTRSVMASGGGVPVGIPKERSPGETDTVCASEFWARPNPRKTRTTTIIVPNLPWSDFILFSFGNS